MNVRTESVSITPQMATDLLRKTIANRPLREGLVRQYANDILAGNWQENGETIKITEDGRLLDGQHRLTAVVKAGRPIRALIVRGVGENSFMTVDTGAKKTAAQIVGIAGYENSAVIAAGARWIGMMEGEGMPSFNRSISTKLIMDVISRHPLLSYYATMFSRKAIKSLLPSGTLAAFVLGAERYGTEIVNEFLLRFESGENLKKTDPVYELRERMISNKSKVSKLRTDVQVALAVKAIKAYAAGRPIGVLRWSPIEDWPRFE